MQRQLQGALVRGDRRATRLELTSPEKTVAYVSCFAYSSGSMAINIPYWTLHVVSPANLGVLNTFATSHFLTYSILGTSSSLGTQEDPRSSVREVGKPCSSMASRGDNSYRTMTSLQRDPSWMRHFSASTECQLTLMRRVEPGEMRRRESGSWCWLPNSHTLCLPACTVSSSSLRQQIRWERDVGGGSRTKGLAWS